MTMPVGTFCNKLRPTHSAKFSDAELIRLKLIIKEMYNDLEFIMQIDFNDALKTVVKNG